MSFFTSPDVSLSSKLLECVFIIIGLISIYAGVKNLRDKGNPHPIGTATFWIPLGVTIAFGRWIPNTINGALVFIMCGAAIFKKVKPSSAVGPTKAETKANFDKIGMKIFIPALSMGLLALLFGLFTKISALVGTTLGVFIAIALLMIWNKKNSPKVFLDDAERFLSIVGPLSMLPSLLAVLGTVFTNAGVGEVISNIVSSIVPAGNVNVGIIVYAIGMMLFTMIMGNAFAAITVMTVGIGAPLVLAYGANPALIGMVALTSGYCGTLLTPMAANFNIVPVAILEMKDKFGVIKCQIIPAFIMIVFQIIYMIMFKFA